MRAFEYPGRSTIHAVDGMAATSQPLATGAALDVLKGGGNALDAAIAAAATLAVIEPESTGIGGDCFVLFCPQGSDEVIAFNGSGRAPAGAEVEYFLERGITEIEQASPHSVTLPGAIDAWCRLHQDHGRMDFARLLEPAIRYARDGYPLHARVAYDWQRAAGLLQRDEAARTLFLPDGKPPAEGRLHRQPQLAETLEAIARDGRAAFYEGERAQAMVRTLRAKGGLHSLEDFAAVAGDYVQAIATDYRGYRVHQIPPNNQGLTALIMLNILEGFDLPAHAPLSVERIHLEIEAGRLAFEARNTVFAEAGAMSIDLDRLLSKDWAAELRAAISLDRAMPRIPDLGLRMSDTVYLCTVDRDRNAVSFINSLYESFGSGILCPETGVLFQNRGSCFRVEPGHPNCIAPNKRPLHTIMPGMVTRNGRALMPYGVMGGDYQPYGHAHFLTSHIDFGLDLQAALDLPRVFAMGDLVEVERSLPAETVAGLKALGHHVGIAASPLGGGQAIRIDPASGVLSAGSDPRKDGCALGY